MGTDKEAQLETLKSRVLSKITDDKQKTFVQTYEERQKAILKSPNLNFWRAIEAFVDEFHSKWFLDLTEQDCIAYYHSLAGKDKPHTGKIFALEALAIKKGKVTTLEICKELKLKRFYARDLMQELCKKDSRFKYVAPPASKRKRNPSTLIFSGDNKKQKIQKSKVTDGTVLTYIAQLKAFMTWLNDDVPPKCFRWMKKRRKNARVTVTIEGHQLSAADLLSLDDIEKIVKSKIDVRDQALIITLYESGMRNTEFRLLKIRDLIEEQRCLMINVPYEGKTGFRPVPLLKAAPYLRKYLNTHPQKDNPDAPLFFSQSSHKGSDHREGQLKALESNSLNAMIKNWTRNAGIQKRIFPHLFRHSRATELVRRGDINEETLRKIFGWAPGSNTPQTYVHLAGCDATNAVLRSYGIAGGEEQAEDKKLMPLRCEQCGEADKTQYPATEKYCRVGHLLKMEDLLVEMEKREEGLRTGAALQSQVIEIIELLKANQGKPTQQLVQTLRGLNSGAVDLRKPALPNKQG